VRGLLSRRQPLFPGARVGALHEALRRAASVLVGDRLFLQLVLLRLLRHAGSRVLVRENRAGEIAINYRGQRLRVRELSFSSPAMGRGRALPLPPHPLPETQTQTGSGQPSSLATRLAANENTGFFLGLVKLQPGTFLLWRMRGHFHCGMTLRVSRD